MKKSYSHSWNSEKLAALDRAQLESTYNNARRLGAADLVTLCEDELRVRGPAKTKTAKKVHQDHSELDVVMGYHFVCGDDLGVTTADNEDCFWSGSWVVAEDNVRKSVQYGAYLALHDSKSSASYRQGQILDYRVSSRGMVSKTENGIEFLVRSTDHPYVWVGAGSGEKGYLWERVAAGKSKRVSLDDEAKR